MRYDPRTTSVTGAGAAPEADRGFGSSYPVPLTAGPVTAAGRGVPAGRRESAPGAVGS
ncbi:hypothetical protein [Streptomyces humi]